MKAAQNNHESLKDRQIGRLTRSSTQNTIYVGNLRYTINEDGLRKMFSKFGNVSYIRLILCPETQKSKGIAFIQMEKKSSTQMAISKLNNKVVGGRTLKVSIAQENDSPVSSVYKPAKSKIEPLITSTQSTKKPIKKKKEKGLDSLFSYLNSKK